MHYKFYPFNMQVLPPEQNKSEQQNRTDQNRKVHIKQNSSLEHNSAH